MKEREKLLPEGFNTGKEAEKGSTPHEKSLFNTPKIAEKMDKEKRNVYDFIVEVPEWWSIMCSRGVKEAKKIIHDCKDDGNRLYLKVYGEDLNKAMKDLENLLKYVINTWKPDVKFEIVFEGQFVKIK